MKLPLDELESLFHIHERLLGLPKMTNLRQQVEKRIQAIEDSFAPKQDEPKAIPSTQEEPKAAQEPAPEVDRRY